MTKDSPLDTSHNSISIEALWQMESHLSRLALFTGLHPAS